MEINNSVFNIENLFLSVKKTCKNKVRYLSFNSAREALVDYTDSILFSNMDSYYCKRHQCYHLGHNKKMKNDDVVARSQEKWSKALLEVS